MSGIEQATLDTMLQHDGLKASGVTLTNVNFQLPNALLTGQVDAVIGDYRNIEALEIKMQGKDPVVFNVEDYGVPAYDELIIVANRDEALNTPLNHQAWRASLPLFAADPVKLDHARYQAYEQFLFDNQLIKKITPVEQYAIGSD